ncbi:MAG: hypothetical protein OEV59_01730 [Deltaproteobacteria bacterium]|nr:hypothetical protein [Deltaproteobacteria bacterium]
MKNIVKHLLSAFAILIFFALPSYAAVPGTMSYQGKLTNNGSGTPVTGPVNITFKIYNVASGGSALWTETINSVQAANGIFTVTLGQTTPITSTIINVADLYIGVTAGSDPEMTPRQKLSLVPFAVRAAEADSVAWSGITSVPAGLSDGDNDTLGGLTCANGQVAKSNGSAWICVADADTTYTAGTGLMLTGTQFSVATPLSLSGANAGGSIITGSNSSTTMNSFGVKGESTALSGFTHGVIGTSSSPNGVGVTGNASNTTGNNWGVYGVSNSSTGYGVYGGNASTGYAGYFNGKTHVQGNLTTSGNLTVSGMISGDGSGLTGVTAAAWGSITGMPAGFSDGTDNDTTYAAGTGLMLTGTTFGVVPAGITSSHIADGTIALADLNQNGCTTNQIMKWNGGAWACAADVDTDTTYSAGTGLMLTGTSFSVAAPLSLSGANAGAGIITGTNTSATSSSAGLSGISTSTTGLIYGVSGQSDSMSGRGVYGVASAASGFTMGVAGQSVSTGGTGVVGWANAASGPTTGVAGQSDSTEGTGVLGAANAVTGITYGVYAHSASTSGTGVLGMATAASGATYGVYGHSNSTSGVGVQGYASAGTGITYGVYGRSSSLSGFGVYGFNSGGGYAGYFSGNTYVSGNFTASGTKSFIQPHINDPGKQINYVATESPEAMVTYRGTAKLVNGEATVILPDYFAIVANGSTVQVQVTPKSADTYGIAVIGETNETIKVKEFKNGTGNFEFNYFVTATRAGFEAHEPVEPNKNFKPMANETVNEFEKRFAGSDLGTTAIRNMLISNGILKADGKVDMAVVGKLGWTFAKGDSSGATVASSSAK